MRQTNKEAMHPVKVFTKGLSLWRGSFGLTVRIYLSIFLPVLILNILVLFFGPKELSAKGAGYFPRQLIFGIMNLILMAVSAWGVISLILAVSTKEKLSFGRHIISAKNYFLPYAGAMFFYILFVWVIGILSLLAMSLGVMALGMNGQPLLRMALVFAGGIIGLLGIFCAVYFAIRLSLCGFSVILESLGAFAALKRSRKLIKDYVTPVIGEFILFMLLALVIFIPAGAISFSLKSQAALLAAQFIANLFIVPMWVCVYVSLYRQLQFASDSRMADSGVDI